MPLMSVSPRSRPSAAVALALALSVSVVGCAASSGEDDVGVKNQAGWAMPLDEFSVYSGELDN